MRVRRNTWSKALENIGVAKIQEMHREFGSVAKLANYLNIPAIAISKFLNKELIDPKKCVNVDLLFDAENKYVSIRDMMNKIGCSNEKLKKSFKYYNLPYPNFRGKYTCNEDFFDIKNLNEKSMYWIGFLAADGNVRIGSTNGHCLKLELGRKDRNHIEKFKKDIESDGRIIDGKKKASKLLLENKSVKEWYHYSYLIITSKKIFDDLERCGIVPRKTYTYTMPQWIIDHPLLNHFIRGYMDADGSYSENKRNGDGVSLRTSLLGACPAVRQIWNILKEKCEVEYGNFLIKKNKKGLPIYNFLFSGIKDNFKIIKYIYKNAITFMDRKKIKTDKLDYYLDKSNLLSIDKMMLSELYDKYGSLNAVSKHLNCDRTSIARYMDKFGLKYKKMPQMARKKNE